MKKKKEVPTDCCELIDFTNNWFDSLPEKEKARFAQCMIYNIVNYVAHNEYEGIGIFEKSKLEFLNLFDEKN